MQRDAWEWLGRVSARLPDDAAFACSTAGWLHGLYTEPTMPFEVMLPKHTTRRTSIGVIVRRSDLGRDESTEVGGVRVTALNRTLRDLCLFGKPVDALIAIDSALRHRRVNKLQLLGDPVAAQGRRGSARLRRLVELAQPPDA